MEGQEYAEGIQIATYLLEVLEVELGELTNHEKEIISAYGCGLLCEYMQEEQNKEKGVEKIIQEILIDFYKYTKKEAVEIIEIYEESLKEDEEIGVHIAIEVGKRNYKLYRERQENELYNHLTSVIDLIVRGEYEGY